MSETRGSTEVAGGSRRGHLVALVAMVGIVLLVVWVVQSCLGRMERGLEGFATLFKPQVTSTLVVNSSIDNMRRRAKLVVTSAEITAEVEKKETYSWWGIYFGTTVARVRAPGCKVQYVIPLERFDSSNIVALPRERVVRIRVPDPVLDEEIVEVNYSNLEIYAASAWARFNKGEVTAEAKKLLRRGAIEQGGKPWVKAQVREDATQTVKELVKPLTEALAPDVRVEVEFVPAGR